MSSTVDTYIYRGDVSRRGYEALCEAIPSQTAIHASLIIGTFGGDADAAFRIARCLRHNYPNGKLSLLIPAECKSAGTLLAIGASELVIFDQGELGPLDVQISKRDDLAGLGSGLDVIQAFRSMREEALSSFRHYLLDMTLGSGQITVKTAGELAASLVSGLFSPIYAQIDPVRLGEIQRAVSVAEAYGSRLDQYERQLLPNALKRLIMSYPSHGFVIDRKEARSLFRSVRAPTEEERSICLRALKKYPAQSFGDPVVALFREESDKTNEEAIDDESSESRSSSGAQVRKIRTRNS